jgi:hypothetical protein
VREKKGMKVKMREVIAVNFSNLLTQKIYKAIKEEGLQHDLINMKTDSPEILAEEMEEYIKREFGNELQYTGVDWIDLANVLWNEFNMQIYRRY